MTYDEKIEVRRSRERRDEKSRKDAMAIMQLAGFTVLHVWELTNQYWPSHPDYDDVRAPWWLFMTEIGLVQVGSRKRVIAIQWGATAVRGEVTSDEVTKGDDMVHAWSAEKAIEYLKALRVLHAKAMET